MKNVFLFTFVLVILNSILIVKQSLGINVILFTLPLLVFLYYYLKLNKLIKNKRGLLFFIPIIILSCMYFVHDNIFNEFNIVIIPILYALMFIYTINKPVQLLAFLKNIFNIFFKPIEYIDKAVKSAVKYFDLKLKLDTNSKKKIKAILIIIPIVLLVFWLLCMADEVFAGLFTWINDLLEDLSIGNIIYRIIIMIILYVYLNASLMFVLNELKNKEQKSKFKIDLFTMKVLTTALNIIYILFDIIQIKSLFLHSVASNINYAQYARSGFFELMIISVINLVIILLAKQSEKNKYTKSMSIVMVFLTLIIIVSSFYRMNLYEQAYGYTLLRLGVYVALITEGILLIPTVVYIVKDKINILNYYVIIITIIYTFINLFSVDVIIAKRNIKRYQIKDDIDIEYLSNNYSDNIPILLEFKDQLKEKELREDLDFYLSSYYDENKNKLNILEYNISKDKALKLLANEGIYEKNYINSGKTSYEIKLYDNSSTGYHWEHNLSRKGIVEISSYTDYSNCPANIVGCGGKRIFNVNSIKPGRTELSLKYIGPDNLVDKKIVYDIWVDDDYIIHEKNIEVISN